jgi:lipopolysaccharide export system protein LptA
MQKRDRNTTSFAGSLCIALLCVFALLVVSMGDKALAQRAKGGSSPLIPGGNSRAPISIDAERLEYLDTEQKFVYSGNVIARQGDATLKAPRVTIFLEKDAAKKTGGAPAEGGMNEQIKRIEADGGVVVTSKDQVGTGERGYYDKPNNKLFLIGKPVLTQGPNVVRGAPDGTLEYDLNTGRANIKGGRVQSIFTPGSEEKKGGNAPRKPEPGR